MITDLKGENPIRLSNAYTRGEIPVSVDHIPSSARLKKSPELKKFAPLVPDVVEGLDVGLLIGVNCPRALEPLQVISSISGSFACRLRHGLVVHGPGGGNLHNSSCNRTSVERVQEVPAPEVLGMKFNFDRAVLSDNCTCSDKFISLPTT